MEVIKHVAEFLMRSSGIDVSKFDDSFMEKVLQKRMTETDCDSVEMYLVFLKHNTMESLLLIESLHICYSEFFRNPLTFAVLERIILPSIVIKKKKTKHNEIRIWSAACAGGQEAYSLAILLEELNNVNQSPFSYRIFATDQSETQVNEAANGLYAETSLNNVNLKRVDAWFTRKGDVYSIKPELKGHIEFSVFDLFNNEASCPPSSIYGDFDLIVCANFLFYYKNKYQKIVLEKAKRSLEKDGFVITGEAERDILMKRNYHEVYPQSAIFQV